MTTKETMRPGWLVRQVAYCLKRPRGCSQGLVMLGPSKTRYNLKIVNLNKRNLIQVRIGVSVRNRSAGIESTTIYGVKLHILDNIIDRPCLILLLEMEDPHSVLKYLAPALSMIQACRSSALALSILEIFVSQTSIIRDFTAPHPGIESYNLYWHGDNPRFNHCTLLTSMPNPTQTITWILGTLLDSNGVLVQYHCPSTTPA